MINELIIGGGLRKTPEDKRDFSIVATFGALSVSDIPTKQFVVADPLVIKDQRESDLCTAYSVTEVSEDQEKVELSPEFQFAKTKQITGNIDGWGSDLRSACKSAVDYGSIKQEVADLNPPAEPRDWKNWPSHFDIKAKVYKKKSYFKIDGSNDTFDNIRIALWQHRKDKCSAVTGAVWNSTWTRAKNGVIPTQYSEGGFGHAFKLFGQDIINGQPYIMAQLSNGIGLGDKGIFYFPRSAVNNEFKFGSYMFYDLPPEQAIEIQTSTKTLSTKQIFLIRLREAFRRYYKNL